jgi:anti-sigma B factor antagonist
LEPVTITLPVEIDMSNATSAGLDLAAALWAGQAVVIADLTRTTFCDGTGARMLADVHHEAVVLGAGLRVAASPRVRRVLTLTGLDEVLAVYPTLSAALAGALPGQAST